MPRMERRAERTVRRGGGAPADRPQRRARTTPRRVRHRPAASREPVEGGGSGMKLLIIIVTDTDADGLTRAMIERGVPATKIGSTGGFLRRGNTTLLSGVEEDRVDDVIALVRRLCPVRTELLTITTAPLAGEMPFLNEPLEVRAGGAVIFVLDIARFERI
jgi:uncharacterized protein YaaQ